MEPDIRKLNIQLALCLAFFILSLVLVLLFGAPMFLASALFGLLYYVVLGKLASIKNRSVITWVGLSFIFSPIGFLISFPLMLLAKPLPRDG